MAVLIRMSPEQRERLAAEARAAGMSMRALAVQRLLGEDADLGKPGPKKPPTNTNQEMLMTG